MIFKNSLHWHRQQVTKFEPTLIRIHLTLLIMNTVKQITFPVKTVNRLEMPYDK